MTYFRIGNGTAFVDNFNSGGMVAPVDDNTVTWGISQFSGIDLSGGGSVEREGITLTVTDGYVYNEGSISNGVRKYIKENHDKFDQIVMNGYSHVAEIKAIKYMRKHNIKFSLLINGGIGKNKEFFLKREIKKSNGRI